MSRNIGFLIFADFNLLDLSGPLSVFETANNYLELESQYVLEIISVKEGAVKSSIGATMHAASVADKVFDVLIIPGGRGVDSASRDPDILALFKRHIASRYVSVCTGAFLLAAAGKLSQKKATTHWARAAELKRLHADIVLLPDEIVVEDGDVWSSAGATAGMDIALALVEAEHGKTLTHLISRILLIPHRRTRGQLQYVNIQAITPPPPRIQKLLEFISLNLQEDLSVSALADRAFLSSRQLSREFINYTGLSPARVVENIRIEFARSKIENTNLPLSSIAKESGFQNLSHMSKAFVRHFNISPRNLRTRL